MDPVQPPISVQPNIDPVLPVSPPQQPPTQPEKKRKRLQSLVIIIAALIVIAIVVPMSLPIIGRMNQQKITLAPSPTIELPANTTPEPTPSWKSFNATTFVPEYGIGYNFSFKYPSSWRTYNEKLKDRLELWWGLPEGDQMNLNITDSKNLNSEIAIYRKEGKATKEFINVGNIGQVETITFSTPVGTAEGYGKKFNYKGKSYTVEFATIDGNPEKFVAIADQILSTLYFSNDKITISCTPRPKCLDVEPYCMLEPMGTWCPKSPSTTSIPKQNDVMCAQDAKECPNGSFVERVGPNCEFKVCPQ